MEEGLNALPGKLTPSFLGDVDVDRGVGALDSASSMGSLFKSESAISVTANVKEREASQLMWPISILFPPMSS